MLGVTVAANMAPSWAVKEQSLARHQGWAKYTRTTGELVLFTSTLVHVHIDTSLTGLILPWPFVAEDGDQKDRSE